MTKTILALAMLAMTTSVGAQQTCKHISAYDSNIEYMGRVSKSDNKEVKFTYPGVSIITSFTGTSLGMEVKPGSGYFMVELDNMAPFKVKASDTDPVIVLSKSLKEGIHNVKVMYAQEGYEQKPAFRGFLIDNDAKMEKPKSLPNRRIEFIGNSITCGYGVEAGNELEHFTTDTENPTKSYSLLLANALNAEVNLVCWSGNGLISHYVDPEATEPSLGMLMPEIYNYTDLSLSKRLYGEDESKWEKWNFESYEPELIFINLGTNDCSWCREIAERNEEFKVTYMEFLKNIRKNNKNAKIVSMLGMMDTRLAGTLPEAVEAYRNESGDRQVFYLELPL